MYEEKKLMEKNKYILFREKKFIRENVVRCEIRHKNILCNCESSAGQEDLQT